MIQRQVDMPALAKPVRRVNWQIQNFKDESHLLNCCILNNKYNNMTDYHVFNSKDYNKNQQNVLIWHVCYCRQNMHKEPDGEGC